MHPNEPGLRPDTFARLLREARQQVSIGVERVCQVPTTYFDIRGKPPVVKARKGRRR
jgi:hypothetical protein